MVDCKECIHYNVCVIRTYPNIFEGTRWDERTCNYFLNTADVAPRADVAREIFADIESTIDSMEYNANTPRKTVKAEELKEQVDWVLHKVIPETLAALKKKYTEDSK